MNTIDVEACGRAVKIRQNEDAFRALLERVGEAGNNQGIIGAIPIGLASLEWRLNKNLEVSK